MCARAPPPLQRAALRSVRRHAAAAAADAQLWALDAQLLARLCAVDARDGGGDGGNGVAGSDAPLLAAYLERLARDVRRRRAEAAARRRRGSQARVGRCVRAVGRALALDALRPAAADALRRIFDECEPHERARLRFLPGSPFA